MITGIHVQVYGTVQGVGYRYTCCREARRRGVVGWVRNRVDGSVEIVAEGPAATLAAFAEWCRQGPPGANVTRAAVELVPATGEAQEFEIR